MAPGQGRAEYCSHGASSGPSGCGQRGHCSSSERGNGVCPPSQSRPAPLTPGAGDLHQRPALPLGRAELRALQVQLPLGLQWERKPHITASQGPLSTLRAFSWAPGATAWERILQERCQLQNLFWDGLLQHPLRELGEEMGVPASTPHGFLPASSCAPAPLSICGAPTELSSHPQLQAQLCGAEHWERWQLQSWIPPCQMALWGAGFHPAAPTVVVGRQGHPAATGTPGTSEAQPSPGTRGWPRHLHPAGGKLGRGREGG